MPLRPCAQPGCPTLVIKGRCAEHAPAPFAGAGAGRSTSARQLGYDRQWDALRKSYLQDNPNCERCGGVATEVDHITPFRRADGQGDDGLRLAWSNLSAICRSCHAAKTGREAQARRHPR